MDARTALAIGRRLLTARERARLTQAQAATRLGVSAASLFRYENGVKTPSLGVLVRMADIYGQPVSWFLEEAASKLADDGERSILPKLRRRVVDLAPDEQEALADLVPALTRFRQAAPVDHSTQ